MKFHLLIIFSLLIGTGVFAQSQTDSVSLVEAIEFLSKKHNIKFAFDHSALQNGRALWPNDSLDLSNALEHLLDNHEYRYEVQDSVVLIIPDFEEVKRNMAVTGIVLDNETGEPLPNATVSLPGSGKYTITNNDGKFSFVNVPYDTSAILVQYLGYNIERLNMKDYADQNKLNIEMSASPEVLKDVMISELGYKVISVNSDPSHISLDLKEFNSITNFGEPDVFRSVQLLPGVSATNETSSGLIIRGGSPEQNLVLFDGFTVYHQDHFFGIYSAFNSNVIKDVQLYKSGYGARWGTRVSGVMDITGKAGNTHKLSGNLGVNLISANATIEVPVSKKTSVLFAARRAYTDIIQSSLYEKLFNHLQSNDLKGTLIQSENISNEPVKSDFYFYDLNAKVTHQVSDRDVVRVSYYQGKDNLKQSNSFFYEAEDAGFFLSEKIDTREHTNWGNKGGSVSYSRQWHDHFYSRALFSGSTFFRDQDYLQEYEFYYDSLGTEFSSESSFPFRNENLINEYSLGLDFEYKINDHHIIDGGLFSVFSQVRYQNFYDSSLEDTDLDIDESGNVKGIYGQYAYLPNSKLSLTGGFRATNYSLSSDLYFEPRLSMGYKLFPTFSLKASMGKYYQFIVNIASQDPTLNGGNFWLMGGVDEIPLLKSYHYVFGFNLNHHLFELDVEGFYKRTEGLTNYIFGTSTSGVDDVELFSTGKGKTYGIDFMIKKSTGPYTGWVAYTLSNNLNKFAEINNNDWYSSDFDERHEIKWVNLLKKGNWEFSMTWIYGSGRPYSVNSQSDAAADSSYFDFAVNIDNPNTKRIPSYHKMDIGVSYLQKLKIGEFRYGLNLLNVYNRRNIKTIREYPISNVDDSSEGSSSVTQNVELLGFTPSIFINFSF
ncbi:MAG: TonB-dependent receptor [Reichenbachiella sp.]|uniref:TonB-dependent receptor n=3 Tax=Reichenbachiella sp. TaxID=2184521 RepID=UPI003267F5CA